MTSLKNKKMYTLHYGLKNGKCFDYEDVKEAVTKLNSVKFSCSDIILGYENCEHESFIRVLEYQNKRCNLCWECLKKEIFGDWENGLE